MSAVDVGGFIKGTADLIADFFFKKEEKIEESTGKAGTLTTKREINWFPILFLFGLLWLIKR